MQRAASQSNEHFARKDAFNNVLTTQKFECAQVREYRMTMQWRKAALELELHQDCSATHHKLQITVTFNYVDWNIWPKLCILSSQHHRSGNSYLKFTPDIDICMFTPLCPICSLVAHLHRSHSSAQKCKYTSWTAACGFKCGYVASCSFNVEQKHKRGLFSVWLLPGRSLNLRRRGFSLRQSLLDPLEHLSWLFCQTHAKDAERWEV